jgi:two-component system sensor histidine kinase SenX3
MVEITVTDQGIGIPPDELDRIFERFYRVDPARHRSTGGTGLGLAIVKHVAASHGGEVRVWSSPGEGSSFTLTLPRQQDEVTQDSRTDRTETGGPSYEEHTTTQQEARP